ncbi:MAG TPA: glucosyl-3-phosphoglycerate synthase [Jatrophihabitans sp.]|nr:glucosyl-3-phosphoglycerate synthase [Jatrophihabitans sp.]
MATVHPPVDSRFDAATSHWSRWPVADLVEAKAGRRISVVIPARDEAATIGGIVEAIREDLVLKTPLVDELVVIDSDSRDETADIAADHGAKVYAAREIRPDLGSFPGKGEALWKSLFVTGGDLLVFIDADLTGWGTHFVTGLVGPLLADPRVELVKGYYDRVLDDGSGAQAPQGGRVTELVARPLLNLFWPELAHVVQPLAGEWAIRRGVFAQLAVPVGYGVEMATLLDVYSRAGLPAVAQVDLGARAHTHQSVHDLGVMAAEIIAVAARRGAGPVPDERVAQLWQFDRAATPPWRSRKIPVQERPPAAQMGA